MPLLFVNIWQTQHQKLGYWRRGCMLALLCLMPIQSALATPPDCMQDAHSKIAQKFCAGALKQSNIDQAMLGYMYLNRGDDIQPSDSKGYLWLKLSATQAINSDLSKYYKLHKNILIEAIYDTAMLYYKGVGIPQNKTQALYWLKEAAKRNHLPAYKQLAKMYLLGEGTALYLEESIRWTQKAAEAGDAESQFKMGLYYETGQGVKLSSMKALQWYQKSCKQSNQVACNAFSSLIRAIK